MTTKRKPYVPPVIEDLGAIPTGQGMCITGTSVVAQCSFGDNAQSGGGCGDGNSALSAGCFGEGNSATGGTCSFGNSAGPGNCSEGNSG